MANFNVGDRLILTNDRTMSAKVGAQAVVLGMMEGMVIVKWDRSINELSNSQMNGEYYADRFKRSRGIAPAKQKKPLRVKPKATNTKVAKLRQHFLSGKSLTQLEAIGLYGAFRLAARVHELKAQGMKIDTFMKEDPNGSPYAEYRLRSAKVR